MAALAFFLVGVVMVAYGIYSMIVSMTCLTWPKAKGMVLRSGVEVEPDGEGDSYTPIVDYEYIYGGKTYQGSRIRFGPAASLTRRGADLEIAKFRNGNTISVMVNPRQPDESVLRGGTTMTNILLLIVGAIIAVAALSAWAQGH